jgi:hypothetical protein
MDTTCYLTLNRFKSLHLHPVIPIICPDGGIGRRVRLKIWYWQRCAGSIPVPGTENSNSYKGSQKLRPFYFSKFAVN